MNQPHDKDEQETPGIALDRFPLRCAHREMTVRLWDFAGQEITHALHQFFLTEGCIYLLVLDPRSNTEMRDAEYWLSLLSRYAGYAPVLIVLNRQDGRQGGYDVDRAMLRERFPAIHSFTPTNCELRIGCDELKQRLVEAVQSLSQTERPDGKAVCDHSSRRAGFDMAQKELESLFRTRQTTNNSGTVKERGFERFAEARSAEKPGIKIITHGGDLIAQVVQTLTQCTNLIQQQAPGSRKTLLEQLQVQIEQLLAGITEEQQDDAPQIADNLELLVKQVTNAKPNRKWVSLAAEGLLDAANYMPGISDVIAGTIEKLGKSLWADFLLPEMTE